MATPVTITTSELNQYSTIMRACITATNACAKLGNEKKMDEFAHLYAWAKDKWDIARTETCVFTVED